MRLAVRQLRGEGEKFSDGVVALTPPAERRRPDGACVLRQCKPTALLEAASFLKRSPHCAGSANGADSTDFAANGASGTNGTGG